jgi:hypothetical protein
VGRRWRRKVGYAAIGPPLLLCTLAVSGGPTLSVGGGPPGGVGSLDGPATPTNYGDCGPGARRETGLQGSVPRNDQLSGASKQGYRCNLRLIGQNTIKDRGANFVLGWYRDCAYVGSVGARELQTLGGDALDGVAVVDASDPAKPKLDRIVRSPVGVSQHEAIEVNEKRGMLVVETGGLLARYIDIYDVSKDCHNPVFKGRYDAGVPIFHGLRVSDDGRTIYATDFTGGFIGQEMHIVDATDMSRPRLIKRWDPGQEVPADRYGIHDLEVSPDGNRAYLGAVSPSSTLGAIVAGPPSNLGGPTMVVLDTSDIQERKPNPDLRVVSDVDLPNFGHAEQRATIDGKPYLFTSGETPFGGAKNCTWAWGNVLDMSDERHPRPVSEIKLEVNEQRNCLTTAGEDAVYSIHYVGVDDERNTTKVFYTYYTGGVRVFDVRDPVHPKEIAYFHPKPLAKVAHSPLPINAGDNQRPAWDSATSTIRYFPESRRLWFVSIAGGFQVLELTTPEADGSARIARQRRGTALRRRYVKVSARCTRACRMTLDLRVGSRRSARRTVVFRAGGSKRVRLKLDRRSRRALARKPATKLRLTGVVRDFDTPRRVTDRFRTGARRLGR